MSKLKDFKFSVSVSGHRNIHPESIAKVKSDLKSQLTLLAESVGKERLELITGLAEGADTFAAQVALDEGIYVRAVLPAPVDIYRSDFKGEALLQFEEFVAQADSTAKLSIEEIPLPDEGTEEDFSSYPRRNQIYVRLMEYLVRRSNIVLALWDGKLTGAEGGTSEVVRNYLNVPTQDTNNKYHIHPWSEESTSNLTSNIIIWIPTRREGQQPQTETSVNYLFSEGFSDRIWKTTKFPPSFDERCEQFTKIAKSVEKTDILSMNSSLLGEGEQLRKDLVLIDNLYRSADQVALQHQKVSDRSFSVLAFLGGGMGLAFLIYAELLPVKHFLILYILILFSGFIIYKKTQISRTFSIHLTARNVAELLRLRFFARLTGVDSDTELNFARLINEHHFASFANSKAVLDFVRCSEPLACDVNLGRDSQLQDVRDRWLMDQHKYFSKKGNALNKRNSRINFLNQFLLPLSLIQAIVLLFFSKELNEFFVLQISLQSITLFLMGLFPLWLAMWQVYENKKASGELQWQYYNQERFFEKAIQQFDETETTTVKRKILSKVIQKSIFELYLWMLHRYHRDHEPPTGA